jgi:hypothetical protein
MPRELSQLRTNWQNEKTRARQSGVDTNRLFDERLGPMLDELQGLCDRFQGLETDQMPQGGRLQQIQSLSASIGNKLIAAVNVTDSNTDKVSPQAQQQVPPGPSQAAIRTAMARLHQYLSINGRAIIIHEVDAARDWWNKLNTVRNPNQHLGNMRARRN